MATLVVQLLRARDDVFYDIDSIPAGERWRDVLLRAIDNASHFYLLWCIHSADSQEVESEYERAISGNKRLVPVLLDSTPLINPLTEYQWVDFRGVVEGHEEPGTPPPQSDSVWDDMPRPGPPPSPPTKARATLRPIVLAALFIVIVAALLLFLLGNDLSVAPSPSVWRGVLPALGVIAVLAALGAFIARRRRRISDLPIEYQPSEYQAPLAAELLAAVIAQDLATQGSSGADAE